jgi:hypothetical protein
MAVLRTAIFDRFFLVIEKPSQVSYQNSPAECFIVVVSEIVNLSQFQQQKSEEVRLRNIYRPKSCLVQRMVCSERE